jgi:hypothetical protein
MIKNIKITIFLISLKFQIYMTNKHTYQNIVIKILL